MASKKEVVNEQGPFSESDQNAVVITGHVLRPDQREKVCRFTLDVATRTPNGKTSHAYVPVVWFNSDSEDTVAEGEKVAVNGSIRTGSYEKDGRKIYTVDVVAEKVIFS